MPPSTSPDGREVVALMPVDHSRNDVFLLFILRHDVHERIIFRCQPVFSECPATVLIGQGRGFFPRAHGASLCCPLPSLRVGAPATPPGINFAANILRDRLGEPGSRPPQTPAFPGRKRCFRLPGFGRLLGGLPTQSAVLGCLGIGPDLRVWWNLEWPA
jgi:hypothetical protein